MAEWLFDNALGVFRCSECTSGIIHDPTPYCPYCGTDMGLKIKKGNYYCDSCPGCEAQPGDNCPQGFWHSLDKYNKWYKDESLCLSCKRKSICSTDNIGACKDYDSEEIELVQK